MNDKQVNLIHWMYHFCTIEMQAQPHKFRESDERLLKEAIYRRFPEHADSITEPFNIDRYYEGRGE